MNSIVLERTKKIISGGISQVTLPAYAPNQYISIHTMIKCDFVLNLMFNSNKKENKNQLSFPYMVLLELFYLDIISAVEETTTAE